MRRREAAGAVRASVAERGPLAVDLDLVSRFFGHAPAWADPAAGRFRYRIDSAAGGWLELFLAPAERLVSIRVADGAVTSLHVDLTLVGVDGVGLREGQDGVRWLEIACGRAPGATPCTVSITLKPDVLVVLGYGR
jgi:hypothetical protein